MAVSGLGGPERNNSFVDPSLGNWSSAGGLDLVDISGLFYPEVSFGLRMFITVVYLLVCAVGLLGNGLVMYLIWVHKGRPMPVINIFVFGLAVADFQFSLTLPFWATEMALDFTWPLGQPMCKVIPSLTILSVYANVFLLTAMSVTRYWSVASAVKDGSRMTPRAAKWITAALWAIALAATMPTIIYTTLVDVAGVKLCIFKFHSTYRLGVYQLQRVVFAFAIPLAIILTSYLLLLRFLRTHHITGNNPKRQNQVATTIRLVVGCFFICWFPNHVVTFWGVLVKFKAVPMGKSFYFIQAYIFPLTTCLAHANSCLNPVLYCLMRNEFRKAMKETFRKLSSVTFSYQYFSSPKTLEEGERVALPMSCSENPSNPLSGGKEDSTHSTMLDLKTREANSEDRNVR
ncbi:relaxin-3 receptor 2-like [Elgaria multicarinata webbii]|uniref:relaxin-3 receptor 2-like n=1 Tax=Elgaria multicarinata webbii TaxID=159646 RepID=UPI002FCD2C8F